MPTVKDTGSDIEKNNPETSRPSDGYNIKPPEYPKLETFREPTPKLNAELERHFRFSYFFGIDEALFKSKNVNKVCGKITKEVKIGKIDKLQIESSYHVSKDSSVEFYIIDQEEEIPILPIEDTTVRNERIFFGLPLRFKMDKSKPYTIKKDGVVVDTTPESAINANDGEYIITYTPIDAHEYTPVGDSVKMKIVLRMYNEVSDPPFIKNALIRTYGGDALWRDRI